MLGLRHAAGVRPGCSWSAPRRCGGTRSRLVDEIHMAAGGRTVRTAWPCWDDGKNDPARAGCCSTSKGGAAGQRGMPILEGNRSPAQVSADEPRRPRAPPKRRHHQAQARTARVLKPEGGAGRAIRPVAYTGSWRQGPGAFSVVCRAWTSDVGRATKGSLGGSDSSFEEAVATALASKGWQVHTQVGVPTFRGDLGVVRSDAPGTYLCGVECDGAIYHRSPVRLTSISRCGLN
jgi:hypothetical protein